MNKCVTFQHINESHNGLESVGTGTAVKWDDFITYHLYKRKMEWQNHIRTYIQKAIRKAVFRSLIVDRNGCEGYILPL